MLLRLFYVFFVDNAVTLQIASSAANMPGKEAANGMVALCRLLLIHLMGQYC